MKRVLSSHEAYKAWIHSICVVYTRIHLTHKAQIHSIHEAYMRIHLAPKLTSMYTWVSTHSACTRVYLSQ